MSSRGALPTHADFARGITAYGDPKRPALLFLHGIRLAGKIWHRHALELSDEFYVLTPDIPGHGALADLPFEAAVIDAFLVSIADSLLSGPPLVIGYSLGGYVAMRYATCLPQRAAGLLICGCSTDIIGWRARLYDLSVAVSARIPPALLQRMLVVLFRLTLPGAVAEAIIPFRFNHEVFEASRSIVCGISYSERLEGFGKPVCIVNGQWDPFRADEARYARRAHARRVVIRGATHVAPLSRPAQFAQVVRAFGNAILRPLPESGSGP